MLIMRITPRLRLSPSPNKAYSAPSISPFRKVSAKISTSNSERGCRDLRVIGRAGLAFEHHAPLLHAVIASRTRKRAAHILLDEDNCDAVALDGRQQAVDGIDSDRRQAKRDFVAKQIGRIADQRPTQRHKLLLSARQRGRRARLESRERGKLPIQY